MLTFTQKQKEMSSIFVLDAGNTSIKVAQFQNDNLISLNRFPSFEEALSFLPKNVVLVVSSVVNPDLVKVFELDFKLYVINSEWTLPFSNLYSTPKTLGIDRLCNVAGMYALQKSGNRLCVDIGTCIKFDFLNDQNEYLGGSISPGARLRFQALNDYTARLPLVEIEATQQLFGDSSVSAIRVGVMMGIFAEVKQMIALYEEKYGEITVFLTGGDCVYFDFENKNNIFAAENLTLVGIFELYKQNASHL